VQLVDFHGNETIRLVVQNLRMKSRTVLVVDNDASFLGILKRLLERNGYQVAKACDGLSAARAIAQESYDLLLTDALFPGQHSIKALVELGKRKDRDHIRIIAMSGRGRCLPDYYLTLARRLGVRRIIDKPFAEEQLLAAIEDVFGDAAAC
jgi:CheY-like chemotaxis protein